jgi:hypothetical protein
VENHPALILVVLGIFAALVYCGSGGRAPDKGTQVALEVSDNHTEGLRNGDDKPDGNLEVFSPTGSAWNLSVYDGGLLYQERKQRDAKDGWSYKYTVNRYFRDYKTDLGAWAGLRAASDTGGESGIDLGIRYSPVRYFYGVVSPDLLVSTHQAGLGVSFYTPSQTVAPLLQQIGIGVGYCADYHGSSGWTPYISLSSHH